MQDYWIWSNMPSQNSSGENEDLLRSRDGLLAIRIQEREKSLNPCAMTLKSDAFVKSHRSTGIAGGASPSIAGTVK